MNKIVLWVNPSFLDYRVPLYKKINDKLKGGFRLIYSKGRIPNRCVKKIEEAIEENALGISEEKIFSIGRNDDFANSGLNIPIPKGLYKLIKHAKPDVIIAEGFFQFTPWAVWYSLIHRIPLLIAYERTAHTERNCPLWRRLYRRFIALFVDGYIANGQLTKEYLISQGGRPETIFTGGMCADSEGLAKSVDDMSKDEKISIRREIIGDNTQGYIYLYVGQIIPRKGVKELLDAWERHSLKFPEDKLLIVGEGIQLAELKEKFISNKTIVFTSGIDYSDIYKYYAVSDVFVIPTLEDNWSLVVPEAMACGLPIASSIYNGCCPELVKENYNGKTFDPLKQEGILETLAYFHGRDLEEMGKNSIEIEKMYSPDYTAENIINAVNSILNKG